MKKHIKWVIAHEPIGLFLKVAENFSQQVNSETEDLFDIEVLSLSDYANKYNAGVPITKYDLLDLINSGEIQMSHIYTTWLGDYNKDMHALDLPFLFSDHDQASRVLEGDIGNELRAGVAEKSNIQPLAFTYSGGYRIVPANFRADTVESWKNKIVRTSRSPVAVDTFKALGAIPKENIALEEMNAAADKGEIDAGESTYVRVFPLGHEKSFKVVNDTAHSLFLTSIIVNKDFYEQFDSNTQRILKDAAFDSALKERKESVADIPAILAECESKGVDVVTMDTIETDKFKNTTSSVYDKYKNYFTSGLVDRIRNA